MFHVFAFKLFIYINYYINIHYFYVLNIRVGRNMELTEQPLVSLIFLWNTTWNIDGTYGTNFHSISSEVNITVNSKPIYRHWFEPPSLKPFLPLLLGIPFSSRYSLIA